MDARQNAETYEAMAKMHDIAAEGLISKAFLDSSEENSSTYLENDNGFMSYDYNQTQTVMNATKLQEGEKYMAIMVPVAKWYDGTEGGVYMRFTESWRSVKTDAWAISKAGVEANPGALDKALALIDYAYSEEGQILANYGVEGESFKVDENGEKVFIVDYNTEEATPAGEKRWSFLSKLSRLIPGMSTMNSSPPVRKMSWK